MKQTFFFLITFLCLTISNQTFGPTELEKAQKKYLKADKELNLVYNDILKEYKADTAFIKSFKNTQRIWIQFRDAEMKSRYPDREKGHYGNIQPICWSMNLTELTEERAKKLKIRLTGIEEGDICAG